MERLFESHSGARPIDFLGALTPPLCYYFALFLLPPFQVPRKAGEGRAVGRVHELAELVIFQASSLVRAGLALCSFVTFFLLPIRYYVPSSPIFTYQLGLVGWYGAGRVLEIFFLDPVLGLGTAKRMRYQSDTPPSSPEGTTFKTVPRRKFKDMNDAPDLVEEVGHSNMNLKERALWALDLMIAMRGVGWDWATADVRHTPALWHPKPMQLLRRLLFNLLPVLSFCLFGARLLHPRNPEPTVYDLPSPQREIFITFVGISLYVLFDTGYTIGALLIGALMTKSELRIREGQATTWNSLLSFPPLYTAPLRDVCSLRDWWSRGWHRLFGRYFLVYGAWPGQYLASMIERKPLRQNATPVMKAPRFGATSKTRRLRTYPRRTTTIFRPSEGGEWGKVLGAFVTSGLIHGISESAALQYFSFSTDQNKGKGIQLERWGLGGEFWFFVLNGVGVLLEEVVKRTVYKMRSRRGAGEKTRWYDGYVGKAWTVCVLLVSGGLFVDGWVRTGIIWEMTGGDRGFPFGSR